MPKAKISFELKNKLSELNTLGSKLENFGQSLGLSKKVIFQVNLVLDELFTNIVSYGFEDHGRHKIKFDLSHRNGVMIIRIEDSGKAFDPASADTTASEPPIENCRIGGLGLHLVRRLIDEMVYERRKNKNIITIKKIIDKGSDG